MFGPHASIWRPLRLSKAQQFCEASHRNSRGSARKFFSRVATRGGCCHATARIKPKLYLRQDLKHELDPAPGPWTFPAGALLGLHGGTEGRRNRTTSSSVSAIAPSVAVASRARFPSAGSGPRLLRCARTRYTRRVTAADFNQAFRAARASAIIRTDRSDVAADAMEAAVRGGFRVIEFTLTTPGAYELIQEFSRREGIWVGAGTVLDTEQAERAVRAGAQLLVSPVADPEIVRAASRLGVAVMPGAHTPTELFQAHRAGAPLQKLFPAPAGGPSFVRAVLGPLPFLNIVPTNGVDAGNARAWLEAGAFAVGFVTALFDPAWLARRDYDAIAERAKSILAALGTAPA